MLDQASLDERGWCTTPLLKADQIERLLGSWDALGIAADDVGTVATSVECARAEARSVDQSLKAEIGPSIARVAPEVEPFLAAFITKGTAGGWVDLHQDWTYHDERVGRTWLFWCPLVDVDAPTGTMHVVSGSHRWSDGVRASGDAPGLVEQVQDKLWPHAEAVPLRAGDALVYDAALVHGSTPTGGRRRPVAAVATAPVDVELVHFSCRDGSEPVGYRIDESWFTTEPFATVPPSAPRVEPWATTVSPLTHEDLDDLLARPTPSTRTADHGR